MEYSLIIKGALTGISGPKIDDRLNEKVHILSTVEIPSEIRQIMALSFYAVAEQLEKDNKLDENLYVNCIISDFGKITIELDDDQYANVISIINYPIEKWKIKNLSQIGILVTITEELAHFFWSITDEVEVNYKVLEIINIVQPQIKMEDLYNIEWMENNKR